jgi:hypothetical protein
MIYGGDLSPNLMIPHALRPFVQRTSLLKHIRVISVMGLSEFFRGSAKRREHRALVRGIHLIEPVACTHSFQFLLTLHQSETTENRAPKDKALKHQSKENSNDVLTKPILYKGVTSWMWL